MRLAGIDSDEVSRLFHRFQKRLRNCCTGSPAQRQRTPFLQIEIDRKCERFSTQHPQADGSLLPSLFRRDRIGIPVCPCRNARRSAAGIVGLKLYIFLGQFPAVSCPNHRKADAGSFHTAPLDFPLMLADINSSYHLLLLSPALQDVDGLPEKFRHGHSEKPRIFHNGQELIAAESDAHAVPQI